MMFSMLTTFRQLMYSDLSKTCRENAAVLREALTAAQKDAGKIPALVWRTSTSDGGRWRAWIPHLKRAS